MANDGGASRGVRLATLAVCLRAPRPYGSLYRSLDTASISNIFDYKNIPKPI